VFVDLAFLKNISFLRKMQNFLVSSIANLKKMKTDRIDQVRFSTLAIVSSENFVSCLCCNKAEMVLATLLYDTLKIFWFIMQPPNNNCNES
jgi:hypothetical protein